MEKSEAIDILKKELEPQAESPRKSARRKNISYFIGALCGFLLLTLVYNIIIHPIDRAALKLAIYDSYSITINVDGLNSHTSIQIDDNLMFYDGMYIEHTDDGIYHYLKKDDGKWYRYRGYPYSLFNALVDTMLSDTNINWMEDAFDSDNYARELLFWKPHKYKGDTDIMGLKNVRTQVLSNKCIISGEIEINTGFVTLFKYTTVEFGQFGWVHLKLPDEFIILN